MTFEALAMRWRTLDQQRLDELDRGGTSCFNEKPIDELKQQKQIISHPTFPIRALELNSDWR
ncbi:hypothetical protein HUJ04_004406 [Dendroctonus ponderosae]|nr:hypothetical protein HUJ04_004406 [Dendroctonus ponderosae]